MKRKLSKKLSLNKETVRHLEEANITGVVGGTLLTRTWCSECTVCTTCFNTCILNTEGACC